jgi:hypothetical protein
MPKQRLFLQKIDSRGVRKALERCSEIVNATQLDAPTLNGVGLEKPEPSEVEREVRALLNNYH